MSRPAQLLALVFCLAVQGGILFGLEGLGAEEQLIVTIEMIWLCASVVIILTAGERFARK
jgi:hypothetical protein